MYINCMKLKGYKLYAKNKKKISETNSCYIYMLWIYTYTEDEFII